MHAHHGVLDAHRQRQHGDDHVAGQIVCVGLGDPGQSGRCDNQSPFDGKADAALLKFLWAAQQAAAEQRAKAEGYDGGDVAGALPCRPAGAD